MIGAVLGAIYKGRACLVEYESETVFTITLDERQRTVIESKNVLMSDRDGILLAIRGDLKRKPIRVRAVVAVKKHRWRVAAAMAAAAGTAAYFVF